jgi:hypothetical protein
MKVILMSRQIRAILTALDIKEKKVYSISILMYVYV